MENVPLRDRSRPLIKRGSVSAPFEKWKNTTSVSLEGVCDGLKLYMVRKRLGNEEDVRTDCCGGDR